MAFTAQQFAERMPDAREGALREQEKAERERHRAEQAERRAARMAQRLRELGIDRDRE